MDWLELCLLALAVSGWCWERDIGYQQEREDQARERARRRYGNLSFDSWKEKP